MLIRNLKSNSNLIVYSSCGFTSWDRKSLSIAAILLPAAIRSKAN